jgi:hypothetical protein
MSSPFQAIKIKDLEDKINEILDDYVNVKSEKLRNGGIPESIYDLVEECQKYLLEIKEIGGVTNPIYVNLSSRVVLFSSGVVSDWTVSMFQHISIPISGMRLGNNFIEVCDVVFKKISEVDVNENTKRKHNEAIYNFELLKLKLSIYNKPKSGCFIATAVYNDYNHSNVILLRKFRDEYLSQKVWGIKFISKYYIYSPRFAKVIERNFILKRLVLIFVILPLTFIVKIFFFNYKS